MAELHRLGLDSPQLRPTTDVRSTHHLLCLDGLRGVAAVAVLLLHVSLWGRSTLLPNAYLSVDFFLMLSGFVLSLAYRDKLRTKMGLWTFLRLRIIRLYPMLALAGLLAVVAANIGLRPDQQPLSSPQQAIGFASLLTAIPVKIPGQIDLFPLNFPEWSLFYEIAFSVAFGVVGFRMTRRQIFVTLIVALLPYLWMCRRYGTELGFVWPGFSFGLLRLGLPFLTGMALYAVWRDGKLPKLQAPFPVLTLLMFVFFAIPSPSRATWLLPVTFTFLVAPLILIASINCGLTGRLRRVAEWSAALSYPVYLIHIPLFMIVFPALAGLGIPLAIRTVLAVALAIGCALAVDKLYDRPVTRALRRAVS